jgi:hypothetical protein
VGPDWNLLSSSSSPSPTRKLVVGVACVSNSNFMLHIMQYVLRRLDCYYTGTYIKHRLRSEQCFGFAYGTLYPDVELAFRVNPDPDSALKMKADPDSGTIFEI